MEVKKHFTEEELAAVEKKSSGPLMVVTATDRFMSGWGKAKGGLSKVGWVCAAQDLNETHSMVKGRSEMKYVNYTLYKDHRPRNCKHFSYYLVD